MPVAAQFDEKEVAQVRSVLNKMAEFIALFETAEDRMTARARAIEERQMVNDRIFNQRLTEVEHLVEDIKTVMTEAGAARWRLAAENALKEGKSHLEQLQKLSKEFVDHTKTSCDRLDKASNYTVKNVTQAVSSFNPDEIKRLTSESVSHIKQISSNASQRITDIMKWFQWKNVGVIFSVILVVTMITGLYLNDEWPWETHEQVVQQRNLAQALVTAWPQLTAADQQEILHSEPSSKFA